jgi:hypothetical protein
MTTTGGATGLAANASASAPHQRRWIVDQLEHQVFGDRDRIGFEIGTKIGPRQDARRLGPLARRRAIKPSQEIADDHHRQAARG